MLLISSGLLSGLLSQETKDASMGTRPSRCLTSGPVGETIRYVCMSFQDYAHRLLCRFVFSRTVQFISSVKLWQSNKEPDPFNKTPYQPGVFCPIINQKEREETPTIHVSGRCNIVLLCPRGEGSPPLRRSGLHALHQACPQRSAQLVKAADHILAFVLAPAFFDPALPRAA